MWLKRFILLFISVFSAYWSSAQLQGEYVQSRILILLDESSSMTQPWSGGKEKYKAAQDLIIQLIDSVYGVNNQVQFGLRVFGHQSTVPEKNCYDTKNEVAFTTDNRSQILLRLQDIHPLGVTPIAFSLQEAAEKDILDVGHNVYSIILITDGGESCGGDICEVMKSLLKSKIYFKPYIVSLENDPALKTTYACMGDFLQVTNEKEVPKAVSTIVEAFRPALRISKVEYKDVQALAANAPSILKVNAPVKKVESGTTSIWIAPPLENIAILNATSVIHIRIPLPGSDKLEALVAPGQPAIKIDTPLRPKPIKIAALPSTRLKTFATADPPVMAIKMGKGSAKMPPLIITIDTPATPRAEKIAKLKLAPITRLYWAMVMETHALSSRPIPPLPPVKPETLVIADPKKTPEAPGKHEFKMEAFEDKETTVEVYFTNGSGKFYTTTPQVMLVDPVTRNVVKKFYRTVDPDGNPDPQTNIPAGVYDLTLTAKTNFVLNGVKVERNKKNKIIVTVKSTTLSFAYVNAAGRPVSEFRAQVTERNKSRGRVENQACTEQLKYEPGNYHIEINTFPQEIRNVDLDFDGETVITLPQPGFAKFVTDDTKLHSVRLFQHLGDKFVEFFKLDPTDPRSQHLRIQPGEYQAHFQKGPGGPAASEKVVMFHIKPTEETTIELK